MDDAPLQYTKPSSDISKRTQLWLCPALSQVDGAPTQAPREQPSCPSSQGSSPGSSPALSMFVSSFPSYLNTALFLAAGNPSWADKTPLESDLKSFLSFFLILEVRKASTFLFSPGEGETTAAGPVGSGGGTFGCLHGPSSQVEHPGCWAGTRGAGWSQGSAGALSQALRRDTRLRNARPSH